MRRIEVRSKVDHAAASRKAALERLEVALGAAAHVLPSQAPIRIFVHHNTLHAYEHLGFDQAIATASRRFSAEPYETERAFARHLSSGRILDRDVAAVIDLEVPDGDALVADGLLSKRDFMTGWLRRPFERPRGAALRWWLEEGGALESLREDLPAEIAERILSQGNGEREVVRALWARCQAGARALDQASLRPPSARSASSPGSNPWVDELLIRFCAAFVDQGVAYWPLPGRERGLYGSFVELYGQQSTSPDSRMRRLACRLLEQAARGGDAWATALEMLEARGIAPDCWADYLEDLLLPLRGWAGMIHQLERRPDRAPVHAPPARLIDYVAIRMTLESVASDHSRDHSSGSLRETTENSVVLELAYDAFQCAQNCGIAPSDIEGDRATSWVRAVASFDEIERRRLLHRAYERRHRVETLDALIEHRRRGVEPRSAARVQAVFCIDDREESLRRHLEEVMPDVDTFGYAGFFGIWMAFQGIRDHHPTPLCPVSALPRHLVVEEHKQPESIERHQRRGKIVGTVNNWGRVGSQTAVRGGLVTTALGLLSTVPLIARCLFPRAAERLHQAVKVGLRSPETRLRIDCGDSDHPAVTHGELTPGIPFDDQVESVAAMLRTIGLVEDFAPLVVVVGHGSSSLNNPHEAAHDCGACGGARGGPNARAFALLANDPKVRATLLDRHGIAIPETTRFVGAYHNTCDDAITYYDRDLVPEDFRELLESTKVAFDRARALDAHERCRRFHDAAPDDSEARSLEHVETRAVDLGQPRPEYGHATNACCIVSPRHRTRGLFLDRRAFLVSYEPSGDPDGEVLGALLESVGPVGAGINLEYYFSFVDNDVYGCGTKLPHNITGLIGVMDGHGSDLRTGLPWQMVEIHEPVRLLTIVESEPELVERVLSRRPALRDLLDGGWIQFVVWSTATGDMHIYERGRFRLHRVESRALPESPRSVDYYRHHREHLPSARIAAGVLAGGGSDGAH